MLLTIKIVLCLCFKNFLVKKLELKIKLMKELTKAEEQVMHIIWEQGKTSVKAILEVSPQPKPAINTVSTIVRILEKKGFLAHEPLGRGYLYFPIIPKSEYTKRFMSNIVGNYFGNSLKDMVSFFARENKMDLQEFEAMMNEIKGEIEDNSKK
jgi:BlaI family penicillinase repressor